jgi:hypothetical protein
MGYAPLVNWRNFTLQNLKAILAVYPDMAKSLSQREAYDMIENDFGGYKKTAYQFACQLGLEDRSKETFVMHDYLYTFSDENLKKYLEFWFKTYYAPNPFVRSEANSILIFKTLGQRVLAVNDRQINFTEFFNNEIGGPRSDILINCIESYGKPLKTKVIGADVYVYILDEEEEFLQNQINLIDNFPIPSDKKDRHLFFNRFSYENFCRYWGISIVLNETKIPQNIIVNVPFPHNRILFGAPGTGKSYKLNEDRKTYFRDTNYERVTFHPNYSYAQFVGSYKPKPKFRKDDKGKDVEFVSYEYVAGPFLRTWVKAKKSVMEGKNENFLLIVEEINRANVAAVFGDVFQLLDRQADGTSEYNISTSEEMRKYLLDKGFNQDDIETITIPSNMYIWSTMNSADQGVLPMDSAFKRRWNFEYIGINEGISEISGKTITLKPYGAIEWNWIRTKINDRLTEADLNVNEDKLIGPFFLSDKELVSSKIDEIFKSKLLMYLFEDVLKHRKGKLFKSDLTTFSKVIDAYDKNKNIFDFEINSVCYSEDMASDDVELSLVSDEQEEYSTEKE